MSEGISPTGQVPPVLTRIAKPSRSVRHRRSDFRLDPKRMLLLYVLKRVHVFAGADAAFLSEPVLDVETDDLDQQTVCGLLPFTISEISIPDVDSTPSAFAIQQPKGFTCRQPLVALRFSAAK